MPQSAQLIEYTTERPDITLVIIWLFLAQFWRQVIRGANDCVGHRGTLIEQFSHAQISNLYSIFTCKKHIYGLDVSM